MTKSPPTSGSEHTFTMKRWGGKRGKGNNNCYAYAVHDYQRYRGWKSQPGERANLKASGKYVSCCLLYTSPSPRDATLSRMPSSA